MTDITSKDHQRLARAFRALVAAYEANRDLVLMGAYRAGADPQLDRAIAMHPALVKFLTQEGGTIVTLEQAVAQLGALLGHEG
jgi:flagellum-specific ATP synthase